mgnify:CR=1 FL=1
MLDGGNLKFCQVRLNYFLGNEYFIIPGEYLQGEDNLSLKTTKNEKDMGKKRKMNKKRVNGKGLLQELTTHFEFDVMILFTLIIAKRINLEIANVNYRILFLLWKIVCFTQYAHIQNALIPLL